MLEFRGQPYQSRRRRKSGGTLHSIVFRTRPPAGARCQHEPPPLLRTHSAGASRAADPPLPRLFWLGRGGGNAASSTMATMFCGPGRGKLPGWGGNGSAGQTRRQASRAKAPGDRCQAVHGVEVRRRYAVVVPPLAPIGLEINGVFGRKRDSEDKPYGA